MEFSWRTLGRKRNKLGFEYACYNLAPVSPVIDSPIVENLPCLQIELLSSTLPKRLDQFVGGESLGNCLRPLDRLFHHLEDELISLNAVSRILSHHLANAFLCRRHHAPIFPNNSCHPLKRPENLFLAFLAEL